MRLYRILVPLVAAVVLVGVVIVLIVAVSRSGPGGASPSAAATANHGRAMTSAEVAELVALKNQAEALAIDGKLKEAHAKYRELFARAQGREITNPADVHFWDLLERAKNDEDYVYRVLLSQQDVRHAVSGLPARAINGASTTTTAATTRSFVETYPPYRDATTRPAPATTQAARSATAVNGGVLADPATGPGAQAAAIIAGLPQPKHLKIHQTPRDNANFSDQLIGQSLAQASDFLLAQFKDGEIQQGKELSETYRQGLNALVVYALLNAGQATRDPRLQLTGDLARKAIERIKLQPMGTDTAKAQQPIVYARSLRAAVLAMANRPEDHDILKDDVRWLIDAAVDGGYSYDDRFTVRVVPTDPRGVGRGMKDNAPKPPAGPLQGPDQSKPKTLAPPRGGEKPANPNPNPPRSTRAPSSAQIFALAMPDPIQLADGAHDPKTGAELGPPSLGRWYPPPPPPPSYPPQELPEKYSGTFVWDNSNSQYGLLGVWAGAEVGIEVPDAYWAAAAQHWMTSQLPDGQWPYRKDVPGGRLAMTCAGIASLLVTHDYLEAPTVAKVGRQSSPALQSMNHGFAWLEAADNATDVMGPRTVYLGYTLHALSRVGLASGYKYLGSHDWFRELARRIVLSQWANGSWGRYDQPTADTLIDTAYTVLFLARGRHPILMNKLRLDVAGRNDRGEWNNRPRDLANLARFASRELERPLNWQIVSIDRDPADWSDAPILYLASHAALKLSDQDIAKIRAFVDGGGMLFTQADAGAEAFNLYVNQLAKKLFPDHELKDLPLDDELYTLQYIIPKPNRPRLRAVSNGARLLWVHSPNDLAVNWQQRAEKSKREAFEMGVNLFVYAGGKTDLRNRLDDRAIPAPTFPPSSTIPVALLKYEGNWNPEPAAFDRFARYLQWDTSVTIKPTPVDLSAQASALTPQDYPIAHLAGTGAFNPTDAQLKALHDYVAAGGTLICEGVGGADSTFADALQSTILPKAFPDAKFEALPPDHALLHAGFQGMEDVWPPRLRGYAAQKLGKTIPPVRMAAVGKGRVLYLPLDALSGLLGSNTWSVFGYEPNESQALMKNIILWTAEHP